MSKAVKSDRDVQKGKRLSAVQKAAIVTASLAGRSNQHIAKQLGINRNTVSRTIADVQQYAGQSLGLDWRAQFDALPTLCATAITRSVSDTDDVHKAAGTAQAHLKGVGIYQPENSSTTNIFIGQIANLPADWQREYLAVEDDSILIIDGENTPTGRGQVPNNGATEAK